MTGFRAGAPRARPTGSSRDEAFLGRALKGIVRDGTSDLVAIEEPLEIRVDGEPLAVTMRTPGDDEELAVGFLFGEGLIDAAPRVGLLRDRAANTIEVAGPLLRTTARWSSYATSLGGVRGKDALEEVAVRAPPPRPGPRVRRALLAVLPDRLPQPAFSRSAGVQATGLFDASGELLAVREDVAPHNAMDKVIGWALLAGRLPLDERMLCVTGGVSFELVRKAAVAGAPILVGVGAPSSLAVELAVGQGMTLAGFARRGRVNVYTDLGRVSGAPIA